LRSCKRLQRNFLIEPQASILLVLLGRIYP
jgi:hypothetical protein